MEILTERSLISDGRGDRRKFDTEPSRCPAKYVPGCVPEMEKSLGVVYQKWGEYIEGDKFKLQVKQ